MRQYCPSQRTRGRDEVIQADSPVNTWTLAMEGSTCTGRGGGGVLTCANGTFHHPNFYLLRLPLTMPESHAVAVKFDGMGLKAGGRGASCVPLTPSDVPYTYLSGSPAPLGLF